MPVAFGMAMLASVVPYSLELAAMRRAPKRVFGILLISTAVARAAWYQIGVIAVIGAGILGLVVYSYVEWSHDPDKTPPAGTTPAGE